MDNLGSITDQSMAGAIATCTHGSGLEYGVISTQVLFEDAWLTPGRGDHSSSGRWDGSKMFR